jgi:hypothetical protein
MLRMEVYLWGETDSADDLLFVRSFDLPFTPANEIALTVVDEDTDRQPLGTFTIEGLTYNVPAARWECSVDSSGIAGSMPRERIIALMRRAGFELNPHRPLPPRLRLVPQPQKHK